MNDVLIVFMFVIKTLARKLSRFHLFQISKVINFREHIQNLRKSLKFVLAKVCAFKILIITHHQRSKNKVYNSNGLSVIATLTFKYFLDNSRSYYFFSFQLLRRANSELSLYDPRLYVFADITSRPNFVRS